MNSSVYLIKKGQYTQLFQTLDEVLPIIQKYPGASIKKFNSPSEAEQYILSNQSKLGASPISEYLKSLPTEQKPLIQQSHSNVTSLKNLCVMKKSKVVYNTEILPVQSSSESENDPPQSTPTIIFRRQNKVTKLSQTPIREYSPLKETPADRYSDSIIDQYHRELLKSDYKLPTPVKTEVKSRMDLNNFMISSSNVQNKDKCVLKIYCDGSCFNNGKKNASGGIGVFFPDSEYSSQNVSEPFLSEIPTNQKCEISALTRAIEIINEIIKNNREIQYEFDIYTDSEYTINCLTQWMPAWIKKNWIKADGQPVKNVKLLKQLSAVYNLNRRRIRIHHVRGHTGALDGNHYADELANEGSLQHPNYKQKSSGGNTQSNYGKSNYPRSKNSKYFKSNR